MGMILEVFFDRFTVLAEQLDVISRMGRRVIITGNQIRQLARRGRNRLDSTGNRPVRLVEDPTISSESFKRLYSGQLAEERMRLAMYREAADAQAERDSYVDCSDGVSSSGPVPANHLYGGNGATGTNNMNGNGHGNIGTDADSPDGADEGLDPAVILANQGWEIYGGNNNMETRSRRLGGSDKNSGARKLLTLENISIVDSSDSD